MAAALNNARVEVELLKPLLRFALPGAMVLAFIRHGFREVYRLFQIAVGRPVCAAGPAGHIVSISELWAEAASISTKKVC